MLQNSLWDQTEHSIQMSLHFSCPHCPSVLSQFPPSLTHKKNLCLGSCFHRTSSKPLVQKYSLSFTERNLKQEMVVCTKSLSPSTGGVICLWAPCPCGQHSSLLSLIEAPASQGSEEQFHRMSISGVTFLGSHSIPGFCLIIIYHLLWTTGYSHRSWRLR